MTANDLATVLCDAADAADANDCPNVAVDLRYVAGVVAEDPVLAVEMWTAMRDALFMISSAERER